MYIFNNSSDIFFAHLQLISKCLGITGGFLKHNLEIMKKSFGDFMISLRFVSSKAASSQPYFHSQRSCMEHLKLGKAQHLPFFSSPSLLEKRQPRV